MASEKMKSMIRQPRDTDLNTQSWGVRAARIYSNIFSPPSTFAMFGFIIAWKELPFWIGSFHAAIFGLLTSLMPILYIAYLFKTGRIRISCPDGVFSLEGRRGRVALLFRDCAFLLLCAAHTDAFEAAREPSGCTGNRGKPAGQKPGHFKRQA